MSRNTYFIFVIFSFLFFLQRRMAFLGRTKDQRAGIERKEHGRYLVITPDFLESSAWFKWRACVSWVPRFWELCLSSPPMIRYGIRDTYYKLHTTLLILSNTSTPYEYHCILYKPYASTFFSTNIFLTCLVLVESLAIY